MGIIAKKFARKPFYVDAIQVTDENISDVATWCNGTVTENAEGKKFVQVRVFRPAHENQTKAYVGDWVLQAGKGYKVYTDKAFKNAFESPFKIDVSVTGDVKPEQISELMQGVN